MSLVEANNVLFSGTSVVEGRLAGVVFATGDGTLLGKIAQGVQLARLGRLWKFRLSTSCTDCHYCNMYRIIVLSCKSLSPQKLSIEKVLLNSSTAFFCFVPEGLMPTVTFSLMISSRQMAKRKVLVRKIDAVETLDVSAFCAVTRLEH